VRSCAKERRDVMKATTHRVGVIFRTWREAKRSIRAAEHA
jgi:aminoglycoside N3'-acetyltransferase